MANSSDLSRIVYHPLALRVLEVRRVERPTPLVARITLGGSDLAGFVTLAPEDHVKLFFPAPGGVEPVLPEIGPQGMKRPAAGSPPVFARDYTPRFYRPESNELVIDFFLHGGGVASRWAAQAAPELRVGVAGPRGSVVLTRNFDWYVLAGDETALPAIARRLEEFPEGTRAQAVILVSSAAERQPLPARPGYDIVWVERRPEERTGAELAAALESLPRLAGEGYAWVSGEVETVRAASRHLAQARGLPRAHIDASGHWRRGVADHDHHAPIEA